MKPGTLLRLAFSGSLTDWVRATLTALAAALAGLAILATGTVLNMAPTDKLIKLPNGSILNFNASWRYTTDFLNQTGMRPGLMAMTAATIIPALVLIAQSARLGGPARDQRMAAMRITGATPRQIRAIAAAEQGLTVGIGAILSMAAYPGLKSLLHQPTNEGIRPTYFSMPDYGIELTGYTGPLLPLPTDTWPAWWSWIVVGLGLPAIAAVVSALALRRIIKAPLASARRARRTRPRIWPVWLIGIGLVTLAACRVWLDRLQAANAPGNALVPPYITMTVAVGMICIAVPLCAASIGYLGAKLTLRFGRRPSTLIAARRVLADPYAGSRAVAALLVSTVLTVVLIRFRIQFDFANEVGGGYGVNFGDEELNKQVMGLLDAMGLMFIGFAAIGLLIALADSAMTRRSNEAALLASGTPNMVLIRARVAMVLLTAVPGVLLGLGTGYAAVSLAMVPMQAPASVTLTCHSLTATSEQPAIIPCTPEGVAKQRKADRSVNYEPAYSHIEYTTQGPWHNVYPPVPWRELSILAGLALAVVALATVLSLLAGRRTSLATALRTT